MEKKMIEKINFYIARAAASFKANNSQWTETHRLNMAKIDGMIEMLKIATGKDYIITEAGLKER